MKKLKVDTIKEFVRTGKIRWTNHCIVRLFQRNISQEDIENALLNGEIIEEYENDKIHNRLFVAVLVGGLSGRQERL